MTNVIKMAALLWAVSVGCSSERRPDTCNGLNESYDNYGTCCDNAQQPRDVNGDRICDLSLSIPNRSDAGHLPTCEEDQVLVCARMVGALDGGEQDGGSGDGGTCECVPEIVVGCPASQHLSENKKECLFNDPPDAGTQCPDPPDVGIPVCPDPVDAGMPECPNVDAGTCPGFDGGTCEVCPACPTKCPSGQTLDMSTSPPQCKSIVRTCGDDFTVHCGANHPDQLMSSDCSCSDPPAACEICPTPIVCQTCTGVGEYLNTKTNPPTCVTPPVPLGTCPEGQTRDNSFTCVSPPAPTLEASFLAPPSLATPAIASLSQNNIGFGTVVLRGPAGKTTEASGLKLAALVADNPTGTYTVGTSGSVRAMDRFSGCKLKDWPPLSGSFGPVAFGADGKTTTLGPITFQGMRSFDIQCDTTGASPVGDTDGFAIDIDSLQGVVVETGGARTPMTAVVANHNGPPPLVAIQVGCSYLIISSSGTAQTVKTKPTFSLSLDSPSGTKGRGWVEIWRVRVTVPTCANVTWTTFSFGVSYTDVNNTHWTDKIIDIPAQNTKLTDAGNFSSVIGTLQGNSRSGGVISFNATFANNGIVIPAGVWEGSVWINATGSSSGDRVQLTPGNVASWKGSDNPSGYPASTQAPDLAAAVGGAITF